MKTVLGFLFFAVHAIAHGIRRCPGQFYPDARRWNCTRVYVWRGDAE